MIDALPFFERNGGVVENAAANPPFTNTECNVIHNGKWYSFTAEEDTVVTALLWAGGDFLGAVSVFEGSDCDNLTCIAFDSTFGASIMSVQFTASAGIPYRLLLSDRFNGNGGPYIRFEVRVRE